MKKALLLHYDLFDTFSLLSDEELGIGKDFEGFDVRAERNERINHILNTIITLLAIRLALIVIYYFYTKFFG